MVFIDVVMVKKNYDHLVQRISKHVDVSSKIKHNSPLKRMASGHVQKP
jgi:hypothetical protein